MEWSIGDIWSDILYVRLKLIKQLAKQSLSVSWGLTCVGLTKSGFESSSWNPQAQLGSPPPIISRAWTTSTPQTRNPSRLMELTTPSFCSWEKWIPMLDISGWSLQNLAWSQPQRLRPLLHQSRNPISQRRLRRSLGTWAIQPRLLTLEFKTRLLEVPWEAPCSILSRVLLHLTPQLSRMEIQAFG